MIFSYSIQWASNHPDEAEEKGEITLEKAIDFFQVFPWADQLQIYNKLSENNYHSACPSLNFCNTKQEKLVIIALKQGFHVLYESPVYTSEIYVADDYLFNPEGITVEEIIELFFTNKIENITKLTPKEDNSSSLNHSFDISSTSKITFLRPCIIAFGFSFLTSLLFINHDPSVSSSLILLIFLLPLPISLVVIGFYFHYFFTDRYKKIIVKPETKQLFILNNGKTNIIHKKDIQEYSIVFTNNPRIPWSSFRYARIKTINNESFIVTCLLVDPMELNNLLKIAYKKDQHLFPIIVSKTLSSKEIEKRKKRYESQKQEFIEQLFPVESDRLNKIIQNPIKYADYAVEAAKDVLQKRNNNAS